MIKGTYFEPLADKKVQCVLCPHNCLLQDGKHGICLVRENRDGILLTRSYGNPSAIHLDPIEKKPLYHFFPGAKILSLGTWGCNMKCSFCQNCEISQVAGPDPLRVDSLSPGDVVKKAKEMEGNIGLAYTYNEPVVFYEYMMAIATRVHEEGLRNVMVTNGFINEAPLMDLLRVMDALNVDLKAFQEDFYIHQAKASLSPLLKNLEIIRNSGRHLEITHLIIPGLNDHENDFYRMVIWIRNTLGKETVLHLSRYFPRYKFQVDPTPEKTLLDFYRIAKENLDFVYIGNLHTSEGKDTWCPSCGKLLIQRRGYTAQAAGLDPTGSCIRCKIPVIIM